VPCLRRSRVCAHGYLRIPRAGIRFAYACAAGVIEVIAAVADPVVPAGLRVAVPMAECAPYPVLR